MFVGNEKAVNLIERILTRGTAGQAYLFSGPEGVGKFFLAEIFAKSLIQGDGVICFENLATKAWVDLLVIRPEVEEKKGVIREKDISVEKIREACKELALFPYVGQKKVLIVDNAHRMNIAAQNAFLKILEEPNSTSVIILVTHDDSKIISTIKSRCQKLHFGLVGYEDMKKLQDVKGIDFIEKYQSMAMGRPGLLRSFLDAEKIKHYIDAASAWRDFSNWNINEKLSYAEKISKDIQKAVIIFNVWIWMFRKDIFDNKAGHLNAVYQKISQIEKSVLLLKNTNVNARLVLENLLISI